MPLTIINSFAWVLKQRIHQIELFLKYPNEVQEELLMNLIQSSRKYCFGKEYDYASIHSYATFAERVPISSYEELTLIERTRKESKMFLGNTHKMVCKSVERPMPKVNLSL
jgi:hypothetical protein